jgi:linoleoyl-CoA desaturase
MNSTNAPKFAHRKQADFYATLRTRINAYFTQNNIAKTGNIYLYLKSVILLSLYILPFISIFVFELSFGWSIFAYILMGIGMSGIGFCIMHDAIHGSYSEKSWVNTLMGYSINIIGGNSISWKIQHNVLHHTFTNVHGHDEDIEDKPILRLSPDGKLYWIHRFQHYYAIFLYGLSTVSWATTKDLKQIREYDQKGYLTKVGAKAINVYFEIIFSKILYFVAFFFLPIMFGHLNWTACVAGFFAMHFVAGIITTVVFQLAHVVEHTDYFQPDNDNTLENSWAVHQLMTTCNFAKNNRFLNWFVGGLNFQVEHHLFTNISHVHYTQIAPIVKETAEEFGIPYYEFDTFSQAVVSHWQTLKRLGRGEIVSLSAE